jgi:hypothetical protein
METSEFRTDNEEHAVKWLRIFDSWKETWVKAEAKGNFGRSIKVGFPENC